MWLDVTCVRGTEAKQTREQEPVASLLPFSWAFDPFRVLCFLALHLDSVIRLSIRIRLWDSSSLEMQTGLWEE